MKDRLKLIASDLDGTLLTTQKELSPATREALDRAIRQGIHVVPATGRSFRAVPDMIKEYPGITYIITANGGAIYSTKTRQRIYQCILEASSVDAILDVHRREDVVMEAFVEGMPYSEERYVTAPMAYGATEYGARYVQSTRIPVKDMERFVREHREKIDSMAFLTPDMEQKRMLREALLAQVPEIYVTSSVPHLLEVGNIRAGKANTLRYLLERLGISTEEAMAFGDADNDSGMLAAVKYGVAVANATPACKEAAARMTDTNDEDGVAKVILETV